MLPLKDDILTRSFPLVTLILIGGNVFIFFIGFGAAVSPDILIYQYGLVPFNLIHSPATALPTVYSSMFLHSGLGHLLGNMLYLWIFGNNVEDALGKFRFILFYFLCGSLAALCHIATNLDSVIPMIGASGAVSGILGAYLLLYPHARVKTLIFLGFFITIVRIPAWVLLAIWIGVQILSGMVDEGQAGVAWFAHIGGFFAGMALIFPVRKI